MDKGKVRTSRRNLRRPHLARRAARGKTLTRRVWLDRAQSTPKPGQCLPVLHLLWEPIHRTDTGGIGVQDHECSSANARRSRQSAQEKRAEKYKRTLIPGTRLSDSGFSGFVKAARRSNLRPILIARAGFSIKTEGKVCVEYALGFCVDNNGTLDVWQFFREKNHVAVKETTQDCIEVLAFYHTWKHRVEEIMRGSTPGDYPVVEVRGMFLRPLKIIYEETY